MKNLMKIFKIFIGIFFVFILNAQAKNPPPGTGSSNIPANILIMLDNSGSMGWNLYTGAQIYYPWDLDVDEDGNMYVLEHWTHKIKVLNNSGKFVKYFGKGYSRYNMICDYLEYPTGIEYIDGYVFVADQQNNKISVWDKNGTCRKIYHVTYDGEARDVEIKKIGDIYYMFIAVGRNGTKDNILMYKGTSLLNLKRVTSTGGGNYWLGSKLIDTWGVALDENLSKLYAVDGGYDRSYWPPNLVKRYDFSASSLNYTDSGDAFIGSTGWASSSNGQFYGPVAIDVDSNSNIYVSDRYNHRIQKFNSNGNFICKYGRYGGYRPNSEGYFYYPWGLAIDSSDNVYIADSYHHSIRVYDSSCNYVTGYGRASMTNRMESAKKAIKKIVSDSGLNSGANFGLMTWGYPYSYRMKIMSRVSNNGAREIYDIMNSSYYKRNSYLNPLYPWGGTYLHYALNYARNYYLGSSSPIIKGASCQQSYLLVISDGVWAYPSTVNNIAKSLNQSYSIKTFAVGFALGGSNSNYKNLAINGGTTEPIYADNENELVSKLTDAIQQVISSTYTFSTPAVMSDVSKGDFIYQSTFEYSKYTQWKGSLKKYKLNSNGTIGALQWDAGTLLNKKKANDRKIWTVGINDTSLNNFTTGNRDELETSLFPNTKNLNDVTTDKLINFVRGIDSYDEDNDNSTSDERHKLQDIYNSDLIVVGAPDLPYQSTNTNTESYYRGLNNYQNFSSGNSCGGACTNRKEIVYAGSNAGLLHAFNANTGQEEWAFLPPSMLGNLQNIISSRSNSSNSIFGVDGSPIVKDVYDVTDKKWKTVLVAGLGAGGHSYFAIDITNPDSPSHLFTIENNPSDQIVHYWDKDGNKQSYGYQFGQPPIDLDYSNLGEAWSEPRITRIVENGKDKWVVLFGGGFNNGTNSNYGSVFYVVDLLGGGKILKQIPIADGSSDNIANSIPTTPLVINADATSKATFKGAMVYINDLEGKLTKINLTNKGNLYDTTQLFDADSTENNGRLVMQDMNATINNDNNLWLYFGTGNTQKLEATNSGIQNRIFGIKDINFPNFQNVNVGNITNCTNANASCPNDSKLGWYVDLQKKQKLTAKPSIFKNTLYVPVYEPSSSNICSTGNAYLYGFDPKCGKSLLSVKVGSGVLTEVVSIKEKIYVGIAGEAEKNIGQNFESVDNLISGNVVNNSAAGGGSNSGSMVTESWKENYN